MTARWQLEEWRPPECWPWSRVRPLLWPVLIGQELFFVLCAPVKWQRLHLTFPHHDLFSQYVTTPIFERVFDYTSTRLRGRKCQMMEEVTLQARFRIFVPAWPIDGLPVARVHHQRAELPSRQWWNHLLDLVEPRSAPLAAPAGFAAIANTFF